MELEKILTQSEVLYSIANFQCGTKHRFARHLMNVHCILGGQTAEPLCAQPAAAAPQADDLEAKKTKFIELPISLFNHQ